MSHSYDNVHLLVPKDKVLIDKRVLLDAALVIADYMRLTRDSDSVPPIVFNEAAAAIKALVTATPSNPKQGPYSFIRDDDE